MPRPLDWTPLTVTDPVPGAPERVADEARRLRDTAQEMRDQIQRLRSIGQDGTLKGEFADALRSAAGELGGRLEQAVGRYEQVAGALSTWEPALQQAQDESVRILERAKVAEANRAANPEAPRTGRFPSPVRTEDERRQAAARDAAEAELNAERRRLLDLQNELDDAADMCAERIADAIDDPVADSGWDDVKDFYDRNAKVIDLVTDIASYVATAVAVAAIFVTMPLAVPLILGGAVLVSQTLLAATDHGSWADVGLSVFGLLTLGAGAAIGKGVAGVRGLSGVQQATRAAGVRATGKAAEKAALRETSALRTAAGRVKNSRTASSSQRESARRVIADAKKDARDAKSAARHAERDRDLTRAGAWERFKTGDAASAHEVADIRAIQARFPDDPRVAAAAAGAEGRRLGVAGAAYSGLGVDTGDKLAEDGGVVPGYEGTKNRYERAVGSTW